MNNTPNQPSRTRRYLRRALIVLAWVVTLFALLYGVENWRGRSAWNNYRKQLEARGEVFDLKLLIPKAVPDDQNFAATPFVKSWFPNGTKEWATNYDRAQAMIAGSDAKKEQRKGERKFEDLVAWEMAFAAVKSGAEPDSSKKFASGKFDQASRAQAAPAVLAGLQECEPALTELRAASQRPYAVYPVFYDMENPWGILLPHLMKIKQVCVRLKLKACAELATGQSDKALEDVRLMHYMADSITNEPLLISYLVRLASLHLSTQPVWEGLADHRWSDAQLQQLQAHFASYNTFADMKTPLTGERAFGAMTPDLIRKKGLALLNDLGNPNPGGSSRGFINFVGRFVPGGWYDMEKLNYCKLFELQVIEGADAESKRVYPKKVAAASSEMERTIGGGRLGRPLSGILNHRVIAGLMLPALGNLHKKAANGQVAIDQAMLACALERHRLAHKEFPETLDALVPEFISQLPHDVITGEPYKYRRTDDGKFMLASVGWNETDDDGALGKTLFDDKEGDWVWY
jgi:hypothetical protein